MTTDAYPFCLAIVDVRCPLIFAKHFVDLFIRSAEGYCLVYHFCPFALVFVVEGIIVRQFVLVAKIGKMQKYGLISTL